MEYGYDGRLPGRPRPVYAVRLLCINHCRHNV